ncbi:baculoviral IAP repeat-containing protein 7-like isoform X2 [Branchiostoma floridae x Branchiostoma japonicum]
MSSLVHPAGSEEPPLQTSQVSAQDTVVLRRNPTGTAESKENRRSIAYEVPLGDSPSDDPSEFTREQARLDTYRDWPRDCPVRPADLARAGFYSLHDGDRVRCFVCYRVLRQWCAGDDPLDEHRKHYPDCPFVRGEEVGNVPCCNGEAATAGTPTCNGGTDTASPNASEEAPKFPQMVAETLRLSTYHTWPHTWLTPAELAQAGFFYTLKGGDSARCFHCGGGLKNWQPGDDPWVEHARWYPMCKFVETSKGAQFVQDVLNKYKIGEDVAGNEECGGGGSGRAHRPSKLATPTSPREMTMAWMSPGYEELSAPPAVPWFGDAGPEVNENLPAQPLNVLSAMETEPARTVVAMGHQPDVVQHAIWRRLENNNATFPSTQELLAVVTELEEEYRRAREKLGDGGNRPSVAEVMDTEVMAAIVAEGYDRGLVQHAVWRRLESAGRGFGTPEEALHAVRSLEEEYSRLKRKKLEEHEVNTMQYSGGAPGGASMSSNSLQNLGYATAGGKAAGLPNWSVSGQAGNFSGASSFSSEGIPHELQSELERLREERCCKVCMDREVELVFLPCGHYACCVPCGEGMQECPMCRACVESKVKVYMS